MIPTRRVTPMAGLLPVVIGQVNSRPDVSLWDTEPILTAQQAHLCGGILVTSE